MTGPMDHHRTSSHRQMFREINEGLQYVFQTQGRVLTITGSDLFDPAMNNDSATRQAIADAASVSCFDPLVAGCLKEVFPEAAGKLAVVPQGVAPLVVTERARAKKEA